MCREYNDSDLLNLRKQLRNVESGIGFEWHPGV
jgi:hypothetical protein